MGENEREHDGFVIWLLFLGTVMSLDIVIPCFNAAATVSRAVESCLAQPELGRLWLIDDASTDETGAIVHDWARRLPEKISVCRLPENGGVARARNWGALQSSAQLVAFLDADDAYEAGALAAACMAFANLPYLGLVRLRLQAVGLPERYAAHADWARAWHNVQMTVGGNTVWRRAFLLACGGFAQDELFRRLGGEDGALGIAATRRSVVGTLFDEHEPAVLHFCRDGMHAERLLDAMLFDKHDERVSAADMAQAQAVTARIESQLASVGAVLDVEKCGVMALQVARE